MQRAVVGVALALCIAVGGACASATTPLKTEYVAAANGVCNATHTELQDAIKDFRAGPDTDERAQQRFIRFTVIKRLRSMMGQLRSIPAPADDGPYLDSMFRDYEHALAIWYSDALGSTSTSATDAAETRFADYGLDGCVKVEVERSSDKRSVAKP